MKNPVKSIYTIKLKNVITFLHKRQLAFTLLELIITMLISGLIILSAFQVIGNFTKQTLRAERVNSGYVNKLQFHKAIANDMQNALTIIHYDDETVFYQADETKVSYQWEFDYMTRNANEVVDTFFIKLLDWHMVKDKKTDLPLILELEIENSEQESELFRVVKTYDNEELFNKSELKP